MRSPSKSASILAAVTIATVSPAPAQTLLVSQSNTGAQAPLGCVDGHVTPNGRWVVFSSRSPLAPEDLTGSHDVYLRDLLTGTTTLVSKGPSGFAFSGTSDDPSISDDGNLVAFTSTSDDLGPGSVSSEQVFLWNRQTGNIRLVSVNASGTVANAPSRSPEISGDGRYVAYRSAASNLAGSSGGQYQIFRCRVDTTPVTAVTLVSATPAGAAAGGGVSDGHAISGDGRLVAFYSDSTDIVPGDTNGSSKDVFVRDVQLGMTTCITMSALVPTNRASAASLYPHLSADGRFVAYSSFADDLVFGDTNGVLDVFVFDRLQGQTTRVSVASDGSQSNGSNGHHNTGYSGASISPDGRFVAFCSSATNLDPIDTYTTPDIFLHDLETGVTRMIGLANGGQVPSGGQSTDSSLSDQAQLVVFVSAATNLLLPAPDSNGGAFDVLLREVGDPLAPSGTCFGDGSAATCPCGNGSPAGARAGCLHSGGLGGRLVASGEAKLSADTLVLHGDQMTNSTALYLQGTTAVGGGAGSAFGDGLSCAGGTLVRLRSVQNLAGASQFPGAGDPTVSIRGGVVLPGTRVYQVWYRDPSAYCTAATFNLTNGLVVIWQP